MVSVVVKVRIPRFYIRFLSTKKNIIIIISILLCLMHVSSCRNMKNNLNLMLTCLLVFCVLQVLTCTPCKCAFSKQLKAMHADCSRHTLDLVITKIPTNLDPQIESISLQEQLVKHVQEEVFATVHLRIVNLQQCKIESIDKNAFRNLRNLTDINLAHNEIETLDPDIFKFNKNLNRIRLNNNKLKSINNGLFANLMWLNKLYLNNNNISDIHRLAFASNVNIKALYLQSNQLSYIDSHLITNLMELFEIYLDENPWSCDCRLRHLHDHLLQKQFFGINARCEEPDKFHGLAWIDLTSIDFACWVNATWNENITNVIAHDDTVTLNCTYIAFPEPNLTWTYNGHDISLKEDKYRFTRSEFVSSMTILKLTTVDRGAYKCKIQNYDQQIEKSFILTVKPARAPVILLPNETSIDVDVFTENFTISCQASGIPAPDISWKRAKFSDTLDQTLILRNAVRSTDVYWANVTFPRLTLHNGGAYTCTAKNSYGIMTKTLWIQVRELQRPKMIETVGSYTPMVTANLTLVCGVQAVPEPKLTWRYEYLPLDPKTLNVKYTGVVVRDKYGTYWYNLTILNIRKEDSGKYFCAVNNSEGFHEKIIGVDVKQLVKSTEPWTLIVYIVIGCAIFGILVVIFLVKCCSRYYATKHFSHEILFRQSCKE